MQTSLSDLSIELPEPSQKPLAEQLPEWTGLNKAPEAQQDDWKSQLANAPILELPTDRPRPVIPSFRRASSQFMLPPGLADGLKTLSRREGVTLFMALLAAFQVLLHRYTGQEDIVVGTAIARSNRQRLENLVNALALRTDLSGTPSFQQLLIRVRAACLNAYAHQDMPFEKLAAELQAQRDTSQHPIFQVMLVLQPSVLQEIPDMAIETAALDLTLSLSEHPDGLTGSIDYNADLFNADTMTRLIGHFQTLLENIVAHPSAQLSELPLLTAPERRQLLIEWNTVQTGYPENKCLHQLFEEQAAKTPDAIAVVFEDQQLNYRDLNQHANRLAHYLRTQGVQAQTLVAIGVDRSLTMIIGLLGILKAGGTYVPLDPSYPAARLAYLLGDCQANLLLTQSHLAWPEISAQRLDLDRLTRQLATYPDVNPDDRSSRVADNPAYVIYTSGSTGNPKGVVVSHANVSRLFATSQPLYRFNSQDVWTLFHSYAFDFSVWELWGALLYGGKLVVVPYITSRSPEEFYRLLSQEGVTVLNQTPSAFRQLIQIDQTLANETPLKLRYVIFGGEALDFPSLAPWFNRHGDQTPQLINMYGITETTVHVTYHALTQADVLNQKSVIGTALPDLQTYILDQHLQPQAIGIPGELYVAGAGVAKGYLNRPELSAEKFIANPFCDEPDARLYKTGDLVRWLPDGNIEYLGRIDQQIKLRGFRIELGEIESALEQHPQLRDVVVAVYEPVPGDQRLAAYLVAQDTGAPSMSELRDFLKPKLPEFMTPSAFVFLDALPLTANGKLDRKALPQPDPTRQVSDDDFIAPRTEMEKRLAGIWGEVLRIDRICIHDNFFALGGHSLLATQAIVRASEQLSMNIPLRTLFDLPTLAELAAHLESRQLTGERMQSPAIRRCESSELPPLSFAQMRMWLLECISGPSGAYNIPFYLQLDGVLENEPALERALNEIVRRHDALRTYFAEQEGVPFQIIRPSLTLTLLKTDLSNMPEKITQHIQAQAALPFDLKQGPLLRAELIRLAAEKQVLLLTFHHIVADGWSMEVFTRELSTLYGAFSRNQPSPLPELPIRYVDYSVWQREQLQGETLTRLLAYWRQRLANLPALELPTDKPRPASQSFRGTIAQFSLPPELAEGLQTLSRREGVTLFMTLAAAFQVLLHRYSGQDDIAIGTPTAGRSRAELEGLIGFFVNTLVLRTDLSGNPGFCELLARMREVALGAYANEDMPFEKLVEELNPQRDLSRNPLFQVMFVLQNVPGDQLQLNAMTAEVLPVDKGTTQFDLTLELTETPHGFSGRVEYATDLFEAATIKRLTDHFQTLLEGVVARPEAHLSELPLLTEPERKQLLVDWNNTSASFPQDQCIHELFEAQAAKTPQAVALVHEDSRLSYAELNAQANRLAHHLRGLGVKPDVRVAICAERSLNMVVGMLAILKAGGAYVPLDPAYPKERLKFMLEDSAPVALLTQGRLVSLFEGTTKSLPAIDLEADFPNWADLPDNNPDHSESRVTPNNLAYVIYTSGSTGQPKGVMIEHKGLCNLLTDVKNRYSIRAEDRILQFAAIAFDMSIQDIFGALLWGAGLVLRTDAWLTGAGKFWALCEQHGVSILTLPTLFWQQLVQEEHVIIPDCVRHITIGGEAVSNTVLAAWFARKSYRPKLFNGYGPTETTIYSTSHEPLADSISWQSIGRPIANTRVYILDADKQPVPVGLAGELYIGGAGIARGYLNRPELTAERFVADPFSAVADARMYKTGDMVRWLADGTLEFLGRNDFQVKIRGFRIETGEIETILRQHPQLREAVVSVYEPAPGDKRLAAYLLRQGAIAPTVSELRDFLKPKLPEFMVPASFMFLDALPLTPNGKLDRKALPKPLTEDTPVTYSAPNTETERKLADIWKELLGLKTVGIQDNFFDLGGHSLLAMQVIVRVGEQLSTEIPMAALFELPTIRQLAKRIDDAGTRASNHAQRIIPQRRSAYKIGTA